MPHFVVDCSESVLSVNDAATITKEVHGAAVSTGLFKEGNIQVRVSPFTDYTVGGEKTDFIHVFGAILEGRTPEQKKALSVAVTQALADLFPSVDQIGVNIRDLEKGTGCSKASL